METVGTPAHRRRRKAPTDVRSAAAAVGSGSSARVFTRGEGERGGDVGLGRLELYSDSNSPVSSTRLFCFVCFYWVSE